MYQFLTCMKKLLFVFCLLFFSVAFCKGQSASPLYSPSSITNLGSSYSLNDRLTDLKGEPLLTGNAVYEDGYPFYLNEWAAGNLILASKKKYAGVFVKLNLQTDKVHYQYQETMAERVAGDGIVREVELKDPSRLDTVRFRCHFPPIDKHDLKTFYQVLADGKVILLKQIKKIFIEEKAFNSATITRRFDTQSSYYVFRDEKMARLKRSKSGILDVLSDQKDLVEKFISNNKLTIKSDDDLAKVFTYYNSLLP
jgi:hypothetical protein